jgi:hypothetical protein
MNPIMEDGVLYIAMRAESEDGKVIGDGMVPIDKDHSDYEKWLAIYYETKKVIYEAKRGLRHDINTRTKLF